MLHIRSYRQGRKLHGLGNKSAGSVYAVPCLHWRSEESCKPATGLHAQRQLIRLAAGGESRKWMVDRGHLRSRPPWSFR